MSRLGALLIDTHRIVGFPQPTAMKANRVTAPTKPQGHGGSVAPKVAAPRVTTQPSSLSVAAGAVATFSATATGSPSPAAQWQYSPTGGRSWANIAHATSETYSFTASSSQNGYEFRALFTNSAGKATTGAATLTVTRPPATKAPTVTEDPSSVSVETGTTASFNATASGSPTPTVQWEQSTDGGGTWADITGATATSYSLTASSSENGYEFRAAFTNAAGSASTTAATLSVTSGPVPAPSPSRSSNWSGYADTGATFSGVDSTWSVPTVTCQSPQNSYSVQWIGIDGFTSTTVEQDGTEADCLGGSPTYDAWYEMYGDSAVDGGYEVELSPVSYPVSPGDVISASVSVNDGTWTLAIADSGRWSFSAAIVFTGAAQSSAEWVVERPEICASSCALTALSDFGTITFSDSSATAGATTGFISAWQNTAMEMMTGSTVLALPSALEPTTGGFVDTWEGS